MRGGHAGSISHATEHKTSWLKRIRNYLRSKLQKITGGVRMSTEVKPMRNKMTVEEFTKLFEKMCEENSSVMRRIMIQHGVMQG